MAMMILAVSVMMMMIQLLNLLRRHLPDLAGQTNHTVAIRDVETINVAPGMQQTRTLSTPTSPMVKMTTTNKHQKVAKGQTLL